MKTVIKKAHTVAQFMAQQTGNVAWLWPEGRILGFKVNCPVSLSALITFYISMLALLGIDRLPTLSMYSGLCSITLI